MPRCYILAPGVHFDALQEDVLARVAEGCTWKNTFNGIPMDASVSATAPTQRVFKVREAVTASPMIIVRQYADSFVVGNAWL